MAHAYTPGLKVTKSMNHSVIRMLPIKGEVMVSVGDEVKADQIVAATYMPGDVYPLNMANLLMFCSVKMANIQKVAKNASLQRTPLSHPLKICQKHE